MGGAADRAVDIDRHRQVGERAAPHLARWLDPSRPPAGGDRRVQVQAEAAVEWITSAQGWAVQPCLDAGLELRADLGAVFLAGEVGPFAPYLPSGAYL